MTAKQFDFSRPTAGNPRCQTLGLVIDRHGLPPSLTWGRVRAWIAPKNKITAMADWAAVEAVGESLYFELSKLPPVLAFAVPKVFGEGDWSDDSNKMSLAFVVDVLGASPGVDKTAVILSATAKAIWTVDAPAV